MYHQFRGTHTKSLVGLDMPDKTKLKTKNKKYEELLEVTDNTMTNKQASVQKLSVMHLSTLVEQPDITIDKFSKLNDFASKSDQLKHLEGKIHTDNNSEIPNSTTFKYSDKLVDEELTQFENRHSHVHDNEILSVTQKNEKGQLPQNLKKHNNHMKKKSYNGKYSTGEFSRSVISHLHMYLDCGKLDMAHNAVMKVREIVFKKTKKFNVLMEMYNILLNTYVENTDVKKVEHVYNLIKNDGLLPNIWTYALMLEFYGRLSPNKDKKSSINQIKADMNTYNITVNSIFSTIKLKRNQQKYILKAAELLQLEYVPQCYSEDTLYSSKLLHNIRNCHNFQSPAEGLFTLEQMKGLVEKQIDAEFKCEVEIQNIAKFNGDFKQIQKYRDNLNELEKYWSQIISHSFEKNLNYLKAKECKKNSILSLHPFLEVLEKECYVNTIMREIRQLAMGSETYSAPLTKLREEAGKFIYKTYSIRKTSKTGVLDQILKVHHQYVNWYLNPETQDKSKLSNHRIIWGKMISEAETCDVSLSAVENEWPREVLTEIGKFLYDIILNDIKFKSKTLSALTIPAFYTLFRTKSKYLVEEIKPHPFVARLYRDVQMEKLSFTTDLLPSYAPPRPWTSTQSGGYLFTKTKFVRLPYDSPNLNEQHFVRSQKQMFPVFDSLNYLAAVPWKINCAVFEVANEVFQNGGSEKLNIPTHPSLLAPLPPINKKGETVNKGKLSKEMIQFRRLKMDMYSLWCDCLYKLSVANHFRDKVFWLPHNIDFRGRVYPVPPHLNHLAGDLGRSLLLFAKGKPLGPHGLDWMKIHLINLTGQKKKCTMEQRLQYANEILDDIIDSAERPLTGKQWWTMSDEPWQTLATCMEIANVLKSPNVEEYISGFPIHQDGSCNGLQHYAALGRDIEGARSVNLSSSTYPGDVYTSVATIVESLRKADAANGIEIAKQLEGFITRKVIKQTVMTSVYGVTKFGAKLQIMKQLENMEDFPKEHIFRASRYLADQTFASLRSMFTSAKQIQDWLTDCAHVISTKHHRLVEWVTPLGLSVVQPYFHVQKGMFSLKMDLSNKPDVMKQRNAFPPNFIHSLDSTHMMLTSLYCSNSGLTFVSVHDCFWTHAATVETMNKICREQFVSLHHEPILENLSAYFINTYLQNNSQSKYSNGNINQVVADDTSYELFRRIPAKGDFDITNVLSSTYFFN